MQYIKTKFLPNTNRIKAQASAANESITLAYDYSLDCEQAHAKVAMELAKKLNLWI